jgi:hypothetical protein
MLLMYPVDCPDCDRSTKDRFGLEPAIRCTVHQCRLSGQSTVFNLDYCVGFSDTAGTVLAAMISVITVSEKRQGGKSRDYLHSWCSEFGLWGFEACGVVDGWDGGCIFGCQECGFCFERGTFHGCF